MCVSSRATPFSIRPGPTVAALICRCGGLEVYTTPSPVLERYKRLRVVSQFGVTDHPLTEPSAVAPDVRVYLVMIAGRRRNRLSVKLLFGSGATALGSVSKPPRL